MGAHNAAPTCHHPEERDAFELGVLFAGRANCLAANLAREKPVRARLKSDANLNPVTEAVSDEQILDVIKAVDENGGKLYRTQTAQAAKLGVTPRTLQRRLKRLRDRGDM